MKQSNGKNSNETNSTASTLSEKTFISLLEEGCQKSYGRSPVYTVMENSYNQNNSSFTITCEICGPVTVGQGKTRKIAEQLAAKNMLMNFVEKERFKDFGLGSSKEEAIRYLANLMSEFAFADDEKSDNWVGKINEICQRLKLTGLHYEVNEIGALHKPLFKVIYSVGGLFAVGQAGTKKIAENIAAQKIFEKLEEMQKNNDVFDGKVENLASTARSKKNQLSCADNIYAYINASLDFDGCDQHCDQNSILSTYHRCYNLGSDTKNATDTLQRIIDSGNDQVKTIFLPQKIQFIDLDHRDTDGSYQCMLKINGPDEDENVFEGTGWNIDAAHDDAAMNALVMILFLRNHTQRK